MSAEKPKTIQDVINKIKASDFTFSKLTPNYFAPAPLDEKSGEGAGAAFVVAREKEKWKRRIKITQLRKLFAEVKELEDELKRKGLWAKEKEGELLPEEFYTRLWLLHPELAYAKGRGLIDKQFFELMRLSAQPEKLKSVGDFRRFSEFLTAILAYSKYLPD